MSTPEQIAYYDTLRALRKAKKTRGGRKLSPSQIRDFSYQASRTARGPGMPTKPTEGEII